MAQQFTIKDEVEFIAGPHKGITGRVIQSFRGWLTVMPPDGVSVADRAAHAVRLEKKKAGRPKATGQ